MGHKLLLVTRTYPLPRPARQRSAREASAVRLSSNGVFGDSALAPGLSEPFVRKSLYRHDPVRVPDSTSSSSFALPLLSKWTFSRGRDGAHLHIVPRRYWRRSANGSGQGRIFKFRLLDSLAASVIFVPLLAMAASTSGSCRDS